MRFLTLPRVMAGMLLVACTVMLYLIEWVEVGRGTTYSDEARRNPYLKCSSLFTMVCLNLQVFKINKARAGVPLRKTHQPYPHDNGLP